MEFVEPLRTQEEINAMKNYFRLRSKRDYLLFMMGINVAYRVSDLLGLTVGDVRGKKKIEIKEMKTGKMRKIPIYPHLKSVIDEYCEGKEDEEYLFRSSTHKYNKPISRVQAYKIIKAGAKQCKIPNIGTHSFRKTFGYHYYLRTKDIVSLMKLFNHRDPAITLRYIGIERDQLEENLMDFGGFK